MTDRASRALFVAEVVLLGLPPIAALGFYAVLMCGWALVGLGAALYAGIGALLGLAPAGDAEPGAAFWIAVAALVGAILPVVGLVALWCFVRVATVFALRGRGELWRMRPTFRRGLRWAVAPMAFTLFLGLTGALTSDDAVDVAAAIVLSGVTLAIPILHLAVEISDRHPPTPPI